MLKSKLKKLVPFRKRRQENVTAAGGMGNCAGGSTKKKGRSEDSASREATVAAEGSKYTHGELVLK